MRAALTLARRGLGRVAPNPAVGCVLVQGDRIVARGWTQPGGRPHAESEALARLGQGGAAGTTAYVTLEPCSHEGVTSPCAKALIEAGVRRCVMAMEDPDPRVSGKGRRMLEEAGVEVVEGVLEAEARALNEGFILNRISGRPLVTLKLATSLDGRIATRSGESQWITGPAARRAGHLLRSEHDAILVGSGTAVADNPRLDVRIPGLETCRPVRVVFDGRLRLPLTHDLVARARQQATWLVTGEDCEPERRRAYETSGVRVFTVPRDEEGLLSLETMLTRLAEEGITRLLLEGGGHLVATFVRSGLVDRIVWFRAPLVIGGDGVPAAVGYGLETLGESQRFRATGALSLGGDLMETYERVSPD